MSGEPTTSDDRIAQTHDWRYVYAKSDENICAADAVIEFQTDYLQHPNIGNALGIAGFIIKLLGEHLVGSILYPRHYKSDKSEKNHGYIDKGKDHPVFQKLLDDYSRFNKKRRVKPGVYMSKRPSENVDMDEALHIRREC